VKLLNLYFEEVVISEGIFPPKHVLIKALEQKFKKPPEGDSWEPMIKMMLQCDPVAVKSSFGKTPYLKNILKWWMSKQINLPEDIPTVRETLYDLHQMRNSNRRMISWLKEIRATNKDPLPIETRISDLRKAIEEISGKRTDKFDYLKIVAKKGDDIVYLIDDWMPGKAAHSGAAGGGSGQLTHRAFDGTRWCVRYENTFKSYSPPFYLFVRGGSKLGLLHPKTRSFKDPNDRTISTPVAKSLAPLIREVVPPAKMKLMVAKNALNKAGIYNVRLDDDDSGYGGDLGDFSNFMSFYPEAVIDDELLQIVVDKQLPVAVVRIAVLQGERLDPDLEDAVLSWVIQLNVV